MMGFHIRFMVDFVSGMDDSCYEYDIDKMLGEESHLIISSIKGSQRYKCIYE